MSSASNSRTPPDQTLVLVSLGSNLGDSRTILRQALERLQICSAAPLLRSSFWQTTPVDCPPGSPPFLNAAAAFIPHPEETPETLLARLQQWEREFGRRPKEVLNEPRPLDLDLIAFGQEIRRSDHLTLPHPRAGLRHFVLAPLAEIVPEFVLPGQALSIAQALAALSPEAGSVCRLPG